MDIIAHGLWTNAIYKGVQRRKRSVKEIIEIIFWSDFPDFFSFGAIFILNAIRLDFGWRGETYYIAHLPKWFYLFHDILYSLPVFVLIFFLIWLIKKRPYWLIGGWFIHILIDIFTHKTFFPPHFLWPFFPNVHLEIISWANPIFMIVNYGLLAIIYTYWHFSLRKSKRAQTDFLTKD